MLTKTIPVLRLCVIFLVALIQACSENDAPQHAPFESPTVDTVTIDYSDLEKSYSTLDELVLAIEKHGVVEEAHIGFTGSQSEQWLRFQLLKSMASNKDLVNLTDHESPTVRCYAFKALASTGSDHVFDILLNHLHDTAKVETHSGCIGMAYPVADYFIYCTSYSINTPDNYNLSRSEIKELDSLLIHDSALMLFARLTAISRIEPIEENYAIVRALTKEQRNVEALKILADYQKNSDKELIASFFKYEGAQTYALYAVREFPDEYFYRYVKEIFEQDWNKEKYDYPKWEICYQALAQYPNEETIEIFERTANVEEDFRYRTLGKYLIAAITKYPNPQYDRFHKEIELSNWDMKEVRELVEKD